MNREKLIKSGLRQVISEKKKTLRELRKKKKNFTTFRNAASKKLDRQKAEELLSDFKNN